MITVVTTITGDKDKLRDDQVKGGAKFIAYMDEMENSPTWEVRPAYDRFKDARRNSRLPKMLIHQYVDTEYSIYMDGNIRLLTEPEKLIDLYLKDHDFALFRHPTRDCLYDEAMVCATRYLDDPDVIIEQAKRYEDSGFPKKRGLCECGILLRRHTPKVEAFNNAWFSEYCRFSVRDQISFMYAADKVGLRYNAIPDFFATVDQTTAIKGSGHFEIKTHNHFL